MFKNLRYTDKTLLFSTLVLFILGLIMVFSASNVTAYMSRQTSPYHYFLNQALFISVGLLIITPIIWKFKLKVIGKLAILGSIVCAVLLVYLLVSSKVQAQNNALSWIDLGFFSLQPSEFVKIFTILSLAVYYDDHKKELNKLNPLILPIILCVGIFILIALEPDLGTAIIYACIVGAIFMSVPMAKKYRIRFSFLILGIVALIGIMIASGSVTKLLNERQASRLTGFSNPCSKLLTTGNQVCNGYIAINNGGLTGVGIGKSTQKYLYLPEPYTDFIFDIIIEELGVLVGIVILLLYMLVLYRILAIGRQSSSNTGAIICYGVAIYIFLHIAVNLTGILGLVPLTGVPLPFMSYGGSFTLCLIIALAAVQKVAIENKKSR